MTGYRERILHAPTLAEARALLAEVKLLCGARYYARCVRAFERRAGGGR